MTDDTRSSGDDEARATGEAPGRWQSWIGLWKRLRPRRRPRVELGRCARVRVHADVGGERKVLAGYVPRGVLEELRRRLRAAKADGRVALVDARPRSAQRVRALVPGARTGRRLPGWFLQLGVSVKSVEAAESAGTTAAARSTERVRVDLQALLREAESVTRAHAARQSAMAETR